MQALSSSTKRSQVRLIAVALVVVLSLIVGVPLALSANDSNASSAINGPSYPVAPAGPQGPITVTCTPGHGAVIGHSDGPAGPQGPVGVKCAPGSANAG